MARSILFILFWVGLAPLLLLPVNAEEAASRLRPLPENEWSPEVARLLGGTRSRVVVGQYTMQSMVANSTGVALKNG
jgi:hypothetical protein